MQIELKKGGFVQVDPEDYENLNLGDYKWYPAARGKIAANKGHSRKPIYLARLITGAVDGERVLHLDGDNLNNTRANLVKQKIKKPA
jgi:hypothetical protein